MRHLQKYWPCLVGLFFIWSSQSFAVTATDAAKPNQPPDATETAVSNEKLTREDLVKLSKAGVKDQTIISQIIASESKFELTADDLVYLKENGVSDALIDFLVNTPTLEKWEDLEEDVADSDAEDMETYLETQPDNAADTDVIYRQVYIDTDYWQDAHPYWYWDSYWHGALPIGYYNYNGCYYYYFGLRYADYHRHCNNYNYDSHAYRPPRQHNDYRYKRSYGDRAGYQRPTQTDRDRSHAATKPPSGYRTRKSVDAYQNHVIKPNRSANEPRQTDRRVIKTAPGDPRRNTGSGTWQPTPKPAPRVEVSTPRASKPADSTGSSPKPAAPSSGGTRTRK